MNKPFSFSLLLFSSLSVFISIASLETLSLDSNNRNTGIENVYRSAMSTPEQFSDAFRKLIMDSAPKQVKNMITAYKKSGFSRSG
jgi:hypothetical protein